MDNLPQAVRRQLEEAEAIMQGAQAQPELPAGDQEPTPTPETVNDTAPTEPVRAEPVQVKPESKNDESTWEQRYKSLQGLFNTRVSELQHANKALTQQVQSLTEKLESFLEQAKQRPETAQQVADPRDIEEFGKDLVEMVQRQASSVLASMASKIDATIKQYDARLSALEQKLTGATQSATLAAEEVFFAKLSQLVPDWEQINADQRFLNWLAEADPVYGVPRQVALTAAQQSLDARRAAAVFEAFRKSIEPTPKPKVEKQVAPSTSASSAPVQAPEKPVYTQAQIQAFYKDVALGRYRGRESEAARIEKDINEAIAEGRIR